MAKHRSRLSIATRRQAVSGLDRLGQKWAETLAETVRVRSRDRQEALAAEIKAYASALQRARMGVLNPKGERSPMPAQPNAALPPSIPPADSPDLEVRAPSEGCAVVRQGHHYTVSSAMLDRFCQLTGVSPTHIGGHGSNLAGIAFYFGAFAILTAGRDVSLERLERLLDQLRACRETVDRFVAQRLHTAGWSRPEQRNREMRAALQALEPGANGPPAPTG